MSVSRAAVCRSSFALSFGLAVLLAACGGKSADEPTTDAGDGGTDVADVADGADVHDGADVGDGGFSCPSEPVTAALVSATPRADPKLEVLALTLGTAIVADEATYVRVVGDVGAIRAKNPALAGIDPRPMLDQSLRIVASKSGAEALRDGKVPELGCHDTFWGGTVGTFSFTTDGTAGSAVVTFKGTYAIDRLACVYATIPGVTQVQAGDLRAGDGSTLFAWAEGDVVHYAFDKAGGDCPAGCTTHHVWHYTATGDRTITLVEEIAEGSPLPSWWSHRTPTLDKCLRL